MVRGGEPPLGAANTTIIREVLPPITQIGGSLSMHSGRGAQWPWGYASGCLVLFSLVARASTMNFAEGQYERLKECQLYEWPGRALMPPNQADQSTIVFLGAALMMARLPLPWQASITSP